MGAGIKKPTVIVSGMAGSGKNTIAEMIAKKYKLNFLCASDILKEMAIEEGYAAGGKDWWDSAQGIRFLDQRKGDSKFDKKLDGILMQRADNGGISMTSWVMPWLFKGDSVKIWLNASMEERVKRIAKRDEISLEEARKIVGKRDKENREHYKNLYGYELDKDLEVFDLIVDTDGIEPDDIMKKIDTYIKSRMGGKK